MTNQSPSVHPEIQINGRFLRIARATREWYEDIEDPATFVHNLKNSKERIDLATFWQRLPETKPKFRFHQEIDPIAALPVTSYDHWWKQQIGSKTRNMIRRAEKQGVSVRRVEFDSEFARALEPIFNESSIRQGKKFWHYGKDAEAIEATLADVREMSEFIGAYLEGELIGFVKLIKTDRYAMVTMILSMKKHWDKSPNNALLAKAVAICAELRLPHLVYASWSEGGLGAFKRHHGFTRVDLVRYYVPLTIRGGLALKLRLHLSGKEMLPEQLRNLLRSLRLRWHNRQVTS